MKGIEFEAENIEETTSTTANSKQARRDRPRSQARREPGTQETALAASLQCSEPQRATARPPSRCTDQRQDAGIRRGPPNQSDLRLHSRPRRQTNARRTPSPSSRDTQKARHGARIKTLQNSRKAQTSLAGRVGFRLRLRFQFQGYLHFLVIITVVNVDFEPLILDPQRNFGFI